MAFRMRLGSYGFEWNPDQVTPPEEKKTVAVQETYNGAAIFQWPQIVEGTEVVMDWDWMPENQFQSIRALYLQTAEMRWIAQANKAFMVVPTALNGKYVDTGLHEMPYRLDVSLSVQLRSTTSAATTTTSA